MGLKAVTRGTSGGGGSGTVTSVATGTGLTGGPITVSGTIALADTAVTPGTYGDATHVSRITVDQQGRITAASEVSITDTGITQLTGDATAGPGSGSQALTLATVNGNVGSFTNANITVNAKGLITAAANGAADTGITQLTGDGTAGPGSGSQAFTLATVNGNVGSFGSASQTLAITANGKGLITAIAAGAIAISSSQVSGLATVATTGAIADTTGTLLVPRGGTGLTSASQGDLLYGSAANTLSLLAKDTNATRYLSNTGSSNNPAWAQIALTTGVTGALPAANGGTGVANNAASTITISGNFATTLTVTGSTGVTLPTTGTLATLAGTETLTNKRINPRITTLSTSASTPTLTAVGDSSDEVDMTVTSSTTTVTFGAPSGTPVNGQKLIFRVQCTNAQTYAYDSIFVGSTDVALPTAASGSSKYDCFGFLYNSTSSKWMLVAKTFGF